MPKDKNLVNWDKIMELKKYSSVCVYCNKNTLTAGECSSKKGQCMYKVNPDIPSVSEKCVML